MSKGEELTQRLFGIILTFLDLFNSKKFLVAIGSAWGIWESTHNVLAALAPVVAYLLAQGIADVGKEAAKVQNGKA